MPTTKLLRRLANLAALGLLLLGGTGCVTIQPGDFANSLDFQTAKAPTRIDATTVLQVNHQLTPEVRAIWKRWMNTDATIENYCKAVANVIGKDMVESDVFTRLVPNSPTPDFILTIQSEEQAVPSGKLVVKFQLRDARGQIVAASARESALGLTMSTYNLKEVLPVVLAALRADMLRDLQANFDRRKAQAAEAEAAALAGASLVDLLVSADRAVETARARNRAIIAAKNQQLPGILREHKTAELSALVVRIEQTILDLNHESEVAKDRAQQATANNENDALIGELRGLTISYRERIELLKPILTAIKEEITNRNR